VRSLANKELWASRALPGVAAVGAKPQHSNRLWRAVGDMLIGVLSLCRTPVLYPVIVLYIRVISGLLIQLWKQGDKPRFWQQSLGPQNRNLAARKDVAWISFMLKQQPGDVRAFESRARSCLKRSQRAIRQSLRINGGATLNERVNQTKRTPYHYSKCKYGPPSVISGVENDGVNQELSPRISKSLNHGNNNLFFIDGHC
jgi:hypothetical protein